MRRRFRSASRAVAAVIAAVPVVLISAADSPAPVAATILPADNLLSNPSFEVNLDPWTANSSPLARVSPTGTLAPPDGSYVAQVIADPNIGNRVLLDNLPGETGNAAAGTTYAGSAWVAASSSGAVGKSAFLVVREKSSSGADIAVWTSAAVTLSATAYQHLVVTGTAHRSGDDIDIYVYEAAPSQGDAIYADAISLESSAPIPITDLLGDSSFEAGGSWTTFNSTLTRPNSPDAPDGAKFARLAFTGATGARMGLHAMATTTTTQGRQYTAGALIRSSGPAAVGRSALVQLKELAADGTLVRQADSTVAALTQPWITASVDLTAWHSGDHLVMWITEQAAQPGDVMAADAAWLAADGSGLGEFAINYAQDGVAALGDTSQYEVVVLQAQHHSNPNLIKRIHTANPTTAVFGSVNAAAGYPYGSCAPGASESDVFNGFGLNYCWVSQTHPDWILHRKTADGVEGGELSYGDNGLVMMNIGMPAVQNAFAEMLVNYFSGVDDPNRPTDLFDGVYLDDVNTTPGHQIDGQVYEYTDEQYGQAMTDFIDNVGHQLHNAGFRTLANVAVGGDYASNTWEVSDALAIAADLDGTNKELMSHYGSNNYSDCPGSTYQPVFTGATLDGWQDYAVTVNAGTSYGHRTMYTGIDYEHTTDRTAMTYGRADFLLTWPGEPGSGAYMNRPCTNGDPADAAWTTQLGLPVEPVEPQVVGGLYVRRYTQGIVLLNPAAGGAAATYALDGSYTDQDGHTYQNQNVSVSPSTALLLTRTSYA